MFERNKALLKVDSTPAPAFEIFKLKDGGSAQRHWEGTMKFWGKAELPDPAGGPRRLTAGAASEGAFPSLKTTSLEILKK